MSAAERLASIRSRIEAAAASVGRDAGEVTLVAVSKGQSAEAIRELYDLGVRDFGESRLQEASPKIESLPADIRWHFIGTLQSNKARRIAGTFGLIHSLAKVEHAREIHKGSRICDVLIEVNLAGESQKSGILPDLLDPFMTEVLHYGRARVCGLMGIGAADLPIEEKRNEFRILRELADRRRLPLRSMGMSADFEAAIQEGATHVRVGTALFGAR